MTRSFQMDGVTYDSDILTPEGKALLARLTFVEGRILEMKNQHALLTRAKNAYIADLKTEIVHSKSGVDLSTLFDSE